MNVCQNNVSHGQLKFYPYFWNKCSREKFWTNKGSFSITGILSHIFLLQNIGHLFYFLIYQGSGSNGCYETPLIYLSKISFFLMLWSLLPLCPLSISQIKTPYNICVFILKNFLTQKNFENSVISEAQLYTGLWLPFF